MKFKKNDLLSLDKFINECLYNKKFGYYIKKIPFGKKGDFITAPSISILFSEMIAIWIISFWEKLDRPKQFNLIELGAGNGEMMRVLVNTFNNFPQFKNSCNIKILEKSILLRKVQKKVIKDKKIKWLNNLKELNNLPSIFIANEFFDALPIKQFIKKNNLWYERYVNFSSHLKPKYIDILFNMKKFEKKLNFKISLRQEFIEYSPLLLKYLKEVSNIIKHNNGGILIIDYGYTEKKMRNTLQAISNHKFTNVLKSFGSSDITYNLSFEMVSKMIKKLGSFFQTTTTQRKFLTKLGILNRAEILSQKMPFSKKADLYFRIKRLIDKDKMGNLFKVLFVTNKKNKFKLGF